MGEIQEIKNELEKWNKVKNNLEIKYENHFKQVNSKLDELKEQDENVNEFKITNNKALNLLSSFTKSISERFENSKKVSDKLLEKIYSNVNKLNIDPKILLKTLSKLKK